MHLDNIIGIDYGSRYAGTTAICSFINGELRIGQSAKKQDADEYILDHISAFKQALVFIDAPLSLPHVYKTNIGDDFFYRNADKVLQAMSPMFLGGLTARAMKLKQALEKEGHSVIETYPAALVKELELQTWYKKDLSSFIKNLNPIIPLINETHSWHEADALLAWHSGYRYINKKHKTFGDCKEGLIII